MTRVLLVDDQPLQRKVTRLQLEDAGYVVDTACGALDAIDRARVSRPDLILSDVLMGDIDGFGLCRRLQRDAKLARVPIVLVSAHYGRDDVEVAQAVGARTLIERTPDFSAELAAVREHLTEAPHHERRPTSITAYENHLRANANQLARLSERAERADERYRMLFDHARDAISILTLDGVIIDANAYWQEVLGVSPAELIGKHIRDFAPPGGEAETVAGFRDDVAADGAGKRIVQLRRPDGGTRYVQFSNQVVEMNGVSEVMAIGRDVTAQLEAHRKLAAAEEMYRSLVERIPDIVWRFRGDGGVAFVSPNVEMITGLTIAGLTREGAQLWTSRIHAEDRQRVLDGFYALAMGNAAFEVEYRFLHADGRTVWLRSRARAVVEDGVHYVDGLTADVTEHRMLTEAVFQSQKMEAIGQLTGGIAHDFNNLLSVVLANSTFLLEELAGNDPRRDSAQDIKDVAERAHGLTRQLLQVSRKQVTASSAVDVNAVVLGIERMLRRLIGSNVTLTSSVAPDLHPVHGNVGLIDQVIMNLVVNARDAMPKGGSIRITTANAGEHVAISVTDTGVGMDEATKRKLFEPFFTTKERGKGTGLGLWTSYGIIQQLGGRIAIDSEVGRGSTFTILLPHHVAPHA